MIIRNDKFSIQFRQGNIFNGFNPIYLREVSLKRNGYDFSVDENAINKSEIINIQKQLRVKSNIKQCSGLSNKCLLYY